MANEPTSMMKPALAPERTETDQSLRAERDNADRALEAQRAAEVAADTLVDRARAEADVVLEQGREKADHRLEELSPDAVPGVAEDIVAEERLIEDESLRRERSSADARLRQEREENAKALARLLPLERNKTDRFLFVERERSDDAIAKRDDFLGMVSHDLRDLLGGIVLSGAVLSQRGVVHQDEEIHEAAARIERYSARMNRLIGDLLDVASIDAGKLRMATTAGDASVLIAEAVDVFQASARAKEVTLTIDPGTTALVAEFDHDRILQVLANLITNAIKSTPSGGGVRLGGDRFPGELRIRVADTGCGIPAGQLTDVFERFWQVGLNDRRGLGLGLYISRCIVEAHGGRIWAESEPGGGSRFSFTLPARP